MSCRNRPISFAYRVVAVISWLLVLVVDRFRRAHGIERQQFKRQ